MKKALQYLFLITLVASTLTAQTAVEFQVAREFSIPTIDSISEIVYNDIDGDGTVEALIRSGQDVVLYSISGESVLWERTLEISSFYSILLADVNRDSIVDIVTATYGSLGTFSEEGVVLTLYDGIYDDNPTETTYPNREESCPFFDVQSSCSWRHNYGLTALESHDYNGDGFNEMIFSYSYKLGWGDMIYLQRYWALGSTRMYQSFPDSLAWVNDKISYPGGVMTVTDETIPVLNCKCYYSDIGSRNLGGMGRHNGQGIALLSTEGFNPDGSSVFELTSGNGKCELNSIDTQCDNRWREDPAGAYHTLRLALLGDLNPANEGLEILIDYTWSNDCDWEFSGLPPDNGHKLRLYSASDVDQITLLWERDLSGDNLFAGNSAYPGYFIGLKDDSGFVFSGTNGQIIGSQNGVPTGRRAIEQFSPTEAYLTVIDSNQVIWYKPAIATDVEDSGNGPELIPNSFSIGSPYPNPFNAELTIPVTNKPGSHLLVVVIDILGRTVDRIFDGPSSQGVTEVIWQADSFASGIYYIRAISNGATATTSALLLK